MSTRFLTLPQFALAVLCSSMLLAANGLPLLGQDALPTFRSVQDRQPRLSDDHDRPYFRETESHRGYEIRDERFTVLAATSREDARWAAGQVGQAWENATRLADCWTQVHRHPDFGLQSLQVVIEREPVRERDAPLTAVQVVGIQSQIQVNIGPEQPSLADQAVMLREATAFAVLHQTGLDSAVPAWVVAGLAGFAGRQGLTEDQLKAADAAKIMADFGGQQWRFDRATSDALNYQHIDHREANQRVAFLLTGDDGKHAPTLLASLKSATAAAELAAVEHRFAAQSVSQHSGSNSHHFDRLIDANQPQYEAWRKDPQSGQPVFKPEDGAESDLVAVQQEMVVLLKLQRRLAFDVSQRPSGTKVVSFDREKGAVIEWARTTPAPASFASFAARLTDSNQPTWATLDVDGSLLLSRDRQRLAEILDTSERQSTWAQEKDRIVLTRRLDAYRSVRGWLEENPETKSRPLAQFELVDARLKAKPMQREGLDNEQEGLLLDGADNVRSAR